MTVNELIQSLSLTAIALPDGERVVSGGYVGDLLSWVMGRAKADAAWITIMTNINVLAVASLADVACVLLAEDVPVEDSLRALAEEKGVNLLRSPLPAYELALALGEALKATA
ncbi:MAG: hypothetical protein ACI39E_02140 [Acutalibacteraceae bacterium]